MKTRLFALSLLAFTISAVSAHAQPTYKTLAPADFKVPAAQMEQWAARLKKLCPPTGWTTEIKGNEISVSRDNPVMFRRNIFRSEYNSMYGVEPDHEGIYRITLRFEPLLSLAEYERLSALNQAAEQEKKRLLKKYNLFEVRGVIKRHPYDGLNHEHENRKQAYESESKNLVFSQLPRFYTPDYSVGYSISWNPYASIDTGDEQGYAECKKVRTDLSNLFGSYNRLMPVE